MTGACSPQNDSIIIVGAGPAGLTAAYELMKAGYRPILFEKSHIVGGISRTESYRGYYFDMGGHRFFTKIEEVSAIWHTVMKEDFLKRPRLSRIYYDNKFLFYPLRPLNAFVNLGLVEAILVVLSYIKMQIFPYSHEDTFEQWVSNRFGKRLYRLFFETYTEKVWGIPCSEISADWAAQRIRGLSLPAAVRNALLKPGGQTITTLIEEFEYPRTGPGALWNRVKDLLAKNGFSTSMGTEVIRVHHDGPRFAAVTIKDREGQCWVTGTHLISSMPLGDLILRLDPPAPPDVQAAAAALSYRDFVTVALIVNQPALFPDNWIYIHSPEVEVGRIQNFKNWSPDMVPDPSKTSLGLEYFCNAGDDIWNMSMEALVELGKQELQQIGLACAADVQDGTVFRQPKAYPVYTGEYKAHLRLIKDYLSSFDNLQTIGRNGLHRYNNQDHSMLTGILAARNVQGENHDVWQVNIEQAYLEEEVRASRL
jgi:protoporphyrinogen oxidase